MITATHGNEDGRHGDEDGRRGKVLRTSRRKGGKNLLEKSGYRSTLSANIRFSGS